MNPEVSILIPTYNSEAYIAQALESIFNQTYCNWEIILVDDASTDSTLEIVGNFNDERLKIISNQRNRGVSFGRNCGIKKAQGNWIALLDSDDWYESERIEKLLLVAQQRNADLVADDLFLICDGEQQPWSTLLQENEQEISSVELIDIVKFVTSDRPSPMKGKRNWSFGYIKPLIKREFLLRNKLKYNEAVNVGEDYILYFECLRNQARFFLISQPYYYYRTRPNSLSMRKPTEYLFQSYEITQSFLKTETSSQADLQLIEALSHNLVIFKKMLIYHRVLEGIQHKQLLKIVKQIIIHPYVLVYLVDKLISILLKNIFFQAKTQKTSSKSYLPEFNRQS